MKCADAMSEADLEDMARAGFSIGHFGKNTFSVYTIPEILLEEKVENIIRNGKV